MMLPLHCLALKAIATAAVSALLFGPPRITVREVVDPRGAPAGAVLLIEGKHHDEKEVLHLTGRAEGLQNGRRVTHALRVDAAGTNRASISRQWATGTPWVLVIAAGVGNDGAHGIAEALVRIDAAGKVVGIDYPAAGWIGRSDTPKRTTEREIDAALQTLVASRR